MLNNACTYAIFCTMNKILRNEIYIADIFQKQVSVKVNYFNFETF